MSRPKLFRDPIHMQLRFEAVDLGQDIPEKPHAQRLSWLLRQAVDTKTFQRLRFIRQNGLANLTFHGMEHSRFNHSMGVLYMARTMYHKIMRNMDFPQNDHHETLVTAAALLHDVGHGPFSHTMEQILEEFGIDFDHEDMTIRIVSEPESEIFKILSSYDAKLPEQLVLFFDREKRVEDSWIYKVVSSQLDGDRLDYLMRDAFFAGVQGPSFDVHRLLDLLHAQENSIAVERGGEETVEAYLLTLDQMYRNIYYHHSVRAASWVLTSAVKRAAELSINGDKTVFPDISGEPHPMKRLLTEGAKVPLETYCRINETTLWGLIDSWRDHGDTILSDLSSRLYSRQLFKTLRFNETSPKKTHERVEAAKAATKKALPHLNDDTVNYYVAIDEPSRTSYKGYNWKPESADDSIWLVGGSKDACPIEDEEHNEILDGLRRKRYFSRLIVHQDVRAQLEAQNGG